MPQLRHRSLFYNALPALQVFSKDDSKYVQDALAAEVAMLTADKGHVAAVLCGQVS